MNSLDWRSSQGVGAAFLVLALVWFLTGRTGPGVSFLAVGVVFITIDQQQRGPKD